jgi:signal transduction histidine kinase
LILDLRPDSLDGESLVTVIRRQADMMSKLYGIEISTDVCEEPNIGVDTRYELLRVSQEALSNAARHARARQVTVRLCHAAEGMELLVSDDGIGFDPQQQFDGHFGLSSMRERVGRLGGTLTIRSKPGMGTTVSISLPGVRPVGA